MNELEKSIKGQINDDNNVVPDEFEEETDVNLMELLRENSPRWEEANILVSTDVENYYKMILKM